MPSDHTIRRESSGCAIRERERESELVRAHPKALDEPATDEFGDGAIGLFGKV